MEDNSTNQFIDSIILDNSHDHVEVDPSLLDIVIIHNNQENEFAITYPNAECGLCLQEIIDLSIPSDKKYSVISEFDLPTDYTYFGAWLYDEELGKVSIDIEKAKEIQKENIRIVRKHLLEKEDVIFMRAVETGDVLEQQSSASRKQILRDITELVDNIQITGSTVDEISFQIESTWDENLLGENLFMIKRIKGEDGSIEVIKCQHKE